MESDIGNFETRFADLETDSRRLAEIEDISTPPDVQDRIAKLRDEWALFLETKEVS